MLSYGSPPSIQDQKLRVLRGTKTSKGGIFRFLLFQSQSINCQLTCHRRQLSSRHSQHLISGSSPCPHRCLKAWLKGETFLPVCLRVDATSDPWAFRLLCKLDSLCSFFYFIRARSAVATRSPRRKKSTERRVQSRREQMELRPGANYESHGRANFWGLGDRSFCCLNIQFPGVFFHLCLFQNLSTNRIPTHFLILQRTDLLTLCNIFVAIQVSTNSNLVPGDRPASIIVA